MNKIQIIGLIILAVLICLQILFINKKYTDYNILQSKNPNKDKFEKIVSQKYPSVFTDITDNWNINQNLKDANKKDLQVKINKYFNYYLIPMCLTHKYNIQHDDKIPLRQESSFRHLICQISGESKIIIFSPSQKPYLYPIKNNQGVVSQVDFWNQDLKKYSKFNQAQYVEIILRQGHMIYIPYKWWYCAQSISESIQISCYSESIFSYFLRF